jgi:hypothetical protein
MANALDDILLMDYQYGGDNALAGAAPPVAPPKKFIIAGQEYYMSPRPSVEQEWWDKGYGIGEQEAVTPEQVRAGVKDIFTRTIPREEMMNPESPRMRAIVKDAWNFVENNLFATGGILKTSGRLWEQYLSKMKAEGRPVTLTEKDFAKFEVGKGVQGDLLSTIRSLQPPGQGRALVSIGELRDKVGMKPEEFDAQLLQLAREGKVALHHHDFPGSLKPEEKARLLKADDPTSRGLGGAEPGKIYYVGVAPK